MVRDLRTTRWYNQREENSWWSKGRRDGAEGCSDRNDRTREGVRDRERERDATKIPKIVRSNMELTSDSRQTATWRCVRERREMRSWTTKISTAI